MQWKYHMHATIKIGLQGILTKKVFKNYAFQDYKLENFFQYNIHIQFITEIDIDFTTILLKECK